MVDRSAGPARMSAARTLGILALLTAGLCSWPSCGGPRPPALRNVLFIVVDTLRWDHVGSYGYERDTTPYIDALAGAGVRFDRAYSPSPWTKPSVASMLTGLYPSGHSVNTMVSGLPSSVQTLPEILQEQGYLTWGIVSNALLGPKKGAGFEQGWERYVEAGSGGHQVVSTERVTRKAVAALEQITADERPFLLFVHYFDPHYNYRSHDAGYAPRSVGRLNGNQDIEVLRRMLPELSEPELRFLRDLYDEEVRFTDAGIGRLLETLTALGLEDETLVVLTADHGEELGERGWLGHTRTLYEELIRVPLVVRAPGVSTAGAVVSTPVSLVSLTPTILELLGIGAGGLAFHESPITSLIRGDGGRSEALVYGEVDFASFDAAKRARKKSVIGRRFKLVRDDDTGFTELYDLEQDPQERENLAAARPALRDRLRELMERRFESARSGTAGARDLEFDEDEIEALRSLGYVAP
ncbi:MAG: sulfatase [Deltaproteobacteria bacterium]|nr:sulfatase [Deltaproteobacteria bacterium]MBW2419819.1 sulfatase [Deltaproteobacteria bacterium]